MASALPKTPTADDFLDWERRQPERYEYFEGLVLAMVGGTLDHNRIVGNIYSELRAALRGKRCTPFIESVKVRVGENVYYPDVVVTCAPIEPRADVVPEPVAVFEVLSFSTEDFDRGRKWVAYREIASLRSYVLVAQNGLKVDVYERDGAGWRCLVLERPGDRVILPALGVELTLAQIYEATAALSAQTG